MLSRSLIDIIGNGDGRSHFAKVGQDPTVKATHAFSPENVTEKTQAMCLFFGQIEVKTSCKKWEKISHSKAERGRPKADRVKRL